MKKRKTSLRIFFIFMLFSVSVSGCHHLEIELDDMRECEKDTDCIIVDFKGCCGDKIAINKKYHYDFIDYKSKFERAEQKICPVVDCMIPTENKIPKCIEEGSVETPNKMCTLFY